MGNRNSPSRKRGECAQVGRQAMQQPAGRKAPKRRSVIAHDLHSLKYRMRKVPGRKLIQRLSLPRGAVNANVLKDALDFMMND